MSADLSALDSIPGAARANAVARNRFFTGMCLAMAAIVLTGFTPTLFGRAFFDVPKMPGYLYLHGIALTGWYALLATQALLVANRNVALHRRLGWAALGFMVLVPVAGMGTQLALPDRARAAGALEDLVPLIQTIFWLNLFATLQFFAFVGSAMWLRKRVDAHKRLMLFASIAILMPAAARLSRWRVFGNTALDLGQPSSTGNDVVFALGALFLLVGAVVVNDLRTTRRVNRVTVIGAVVLVGMALLVPAVANSEWGKGIVWALA